MSKDQTSRRAFLEGCAAAGAAASLPAFSFPGAFGLPARPRARTAENPVLVVVYLRGGQDPLNVVVPYSDARYYELRPTIAIPAKKGDGAEGVIQLDKDFGLHPALAPIEPLWRSGRFAPVLGTGSPHPTRSHFDAQDFMEYAAPGLRTIHDGWLNRYLAATAGRWGPDSELRSVAMQGLLPRSLRGQYPVLAVPDSRRGRGASRSGDPVLELFDDLYAEPKAPEGEASAKKKPKGMRRRVERREDPVVASGAATIRTLRRYREIQERGAALSSGVRYPQGRLGDKLAGIARIVKAGERLEVACADWNGWDHHAGEGGESGAMARMLGHLAGSVAAFFADIGQHARRTVLVTMTEFGRTCRENGNAGTDHGHGSSMLAFGAVHGGKVLGRFPGLADSELYQARDLAVTVDFRDVFAELLRGHMRVKKLPKGFFPDYAPKKKGKGVGLFS